MSPFGQGFAVNGHIAVCDVFISVCKVSSQHYLPFSVKDIYNMTKKENYFIVIGWEKANLWLAFNLNCSEINVCMFVILSVVRGTVWKLIKQRGSDLHFTHDVFENSSNCICLKA